MTLTNTSDITKLIDGAIRFFLYVFIFWLPYSPAVIETCIVICVVLWIVKRSLMFFSEKDGNLFSARGIKRLLKSFIFQQSILNQPIMAFIFVCFLSILSSAFWQRSLLGFFTKTLEWFVIYFLFVETFKNKRHLAIALSIFVFTSFATCLDGIVQFFVTRTDIFYHYVLANGGGATASFRHYNNFGGYLTCFVPLSLSIALVNRKKRFYPYALIIFLAALLAAIITFSRGAWVGIIIGILFFVFFTHKRIFILILLLLSCLTMLYFAFPQENAANLRLNRYNIADTILQRAKYSEDSMLMIKDKPILGHGLNTFMILFQAYRTDRGNPPSYAHNCYVQMASEIGIAGLICFFWIMGCLFKTVIQRISNTLWLKEGSGVIQLGCLSGILAFLIHSCVDTHFYSLQLVDLFWFMVGLVVVIDKLSYIGDAPAKQFS